MTIQSAIAELSGSTQELADKVEGLKRAFSERGEVNKTEAATSFSDEEFKKQYQQAYRLWNRDENETALEAALALAKDARFGSLSSKEKFKVSNLQFRIALDLQNSEVALAAYAQMQTLAPCATETSEAGFLVAMKHLGVGEAKHAEEVFNAQCDPDTTPSNMVRRAYWAARLKEAQGQSASAEYRRIRDMNVPGYYSYLALARLGESWSVSNWDVNSYRTATIEVPYGVESLIQEAELSLQANLRNDAGVFLLAAAQKIKNGLSKEHVPALLYVAYLFQAAGLQLESMRIYSVVTEFALANPGTVNFDFLKEMFPAPHLSVIEALSKVWKVDGDFLYALMRQESAFNPGAISMANARGLMQLMPFLGGQIAKQWKYDLYFSNRSLLFGKENLKFAAYHLQQIQTIMPHVALMAASYNAGARRVVQWWKRGPDLPMDIFVELIPVAETRNYVKLVLRNYVYYKLLRAGGRMEPGIVPPSLPAGAMISLHN